MLPKLSPFQLWTLQNFPFIEADFDALTNYQLMCKIVEYLNTNIDLINQQTGVITNLNNNFNNLKTYVDNYFKNLDVQDEINNKLDQMVTDGTLNTIFNNLLLTKNTYRTNLAMNKIGRLNMSDYLLNGYSIQAGCYINDNQYIFAGIKNDSVGSAKLFKVDFELGKIIDTNDVVGLFHANGCCFKNNSLYFCQTFDNNHNNKYGIVEVNATSLAVTNTYQIDFNNNTQNQILSLGYDSKFNKFYLIGYDYFYRCDINFKVEEIIKFNKEFIKESGIRQGGTFYEDYVCYINCSENSIICYDRTGNIHHIIDIGFNQLSSNFGEIENINIINNKLYFISNLSFSGNPEILLTQFYYADLGSGGLAHLDTNTLFFKDNSIIEVIVNNTIYNTLSDIDKFTCNGTASKPYETLGEAIENSSNKFCYNIIITDTIDYNELLTIYKKDIIIKGNSSKIKALKIVNSRVLISSLIINHSVGFNYMIGDISQSYHTPLYITYNSIVTLLGNTGFSMSNCIADNIQYRYVIENSIINDSSITDSGLGITKFTNKDLTDNTYYPLALYNATINTDSAMGIKTQNIKKSLYKVVNPVAGVQTVTMTNIPNYYNSEKGFYLAINVAGIGNTDFQKISSNNSSRFIILETPAVGSYMIQVAFSGNTLILTPYKKAVGSNTWASDNTFNFYPYFEFDL